MTLSFVSRACFVSFLFIEGFEVVNSGGDADRFQCIESCIICGGNGFQNFHGDFFRCCGKCGEGETAVMLAGVAGVQGKDSHLFREGDSEIHEGVAEERDSFIRDVKE